MNMQRRRPGFALAVALAAIVIIGALVAGVFYASTQEFRIGRNTILKARALAAAEYGASYMLSGKGPDQWQTAWNTSSDSGIIGTRAYTLSNGAIDTVRITNLGNGNFFLTSEGRAGSGSTAQARSRIGVLVMLSVAQFNILAALTTRGSTKIGGSSFIDGNDDTIPHWNCPPPGGALPALTTNDTTKVTFSGCKNETCLSGDPRMQQSPLAGDDSTYDKFGDVSWSDLASMATLRIPGGSTLSGMKVSYYNNTCYTADPYNWGDPYRTDGKGYCADYYPVIYVPGDLHVTGGYGQGILLVDGDLQVSGGFEFYGPVIVRKNLQTTGTGGHFNGGVLAANVDFEQNTVLGNAVVNYSQCALNKAVQGSASPSLAHGRSWVELQ
ncbi:MAG: hypothetical protein IRY91_04930 [Gemmatimonadaceae bacterium]|nr:hypothetical protein [Gemmatimonadaceae bacterium]